MSEYYEGPSYGIRDVQQDDPVAYCDKCQGELYGGEKVFYMNGKTFCEECFRDWLLELLNTTPSQLADMVGADMGTIERRTAHDPLF